MQIQILDRIILNGQNISECLNITFAPCEDERSPWEASSQPICFTWKKKRYINTVNMYSTSNTSFITEERGLLPWVSHLYTYLFISLRHQFFNLSSGRTYLYNFCRQEELLSVGSFAKNCFLSVLLWDEVMSIISVVRKNCGVLILPSGRTAVCRFCSEEEQLSLCSVVRKNGCLPVLSWGRTAVCRFCRQEWQLSIGSVVRKNSCLSVLSSRKTAVYRFCRQEEHLSIGSVVKKNSCLSVVGKSCSILALSSEKKLRSLWVFFTFYVSETSLLLHTPTFSSWHHQNLTTASHWNAHRLLQKPCISILNELWKTVTN